MRSTTALAEPDTPFTHDGDDPTAPRDPTSSLDPLFRRHAPWLTAFLRLRYGRETAEDLVQETFLRAWRSRDRFDPRRASERTWLFAIARNVVTDAVRARARLGRIGSDALLEQQPSSDRDPLERLRIVEGLSRLTEAHREVVVAVHLDGRSYQELADATGTPVATLRTRAFHALRALRGHLEGSEEPDAQS